MDEPEWMVQDAMRRNRWKSCCEAIEQYPALKLRLKRQERDAAQLRYQRHCSCYPEMPESIRNRFQDSGQEEKLDTVPPGNSWICMSEELVVDQPRNWPGDDLISHMQGHLMGMIMWASTIWYEPSISRGGTCTSPPRSNHGSGEGRPCMSSSAGPCGRFSTCSAMSRRPCGCTGTTPSRGIRADGATPRAMLCRRPVKPL